MAAWHKALKNAEEYVERHVVVGCRCGDHHSTSPTLETPPTSSDRRKWTTKMDMVGYVKEAGWTYDKDGNWLCPKCSKDQLRLANQVTHTRVSEAAAPGVTSSQE